MIIILVRGKEGVSLPQWESKINYYFAPDTDMLMGFGENTSVVCRAEITGKRCGLTAGGS